MANFIPEQTLEEIQIRSDIVEVISHYIPLKRAGANFKALCPFHNERTPSFIVSPSKQIFHCFGCGEGGNVFGFVMKYEHLTFVDAVKLLADKAGVVIPEQKEKIGTDKAKGLWEVNKFACGLFNKWLCNPDVGKPAYTYLKKRGIKDEIINKFKLGYAPGGNELLKEVKKAGISTDLLKQAGLVVAGNSGPQDMFRNRLIFPIFNATGNVAGFSGRVLDDKLPKYINTPETQIFHKGKVLYGLDISKSEIMKQRQVIICEGYFDFMRLYQEGIRYAVASQGTAFTEDQVHLLRRYTEEIVVSFDSDIAGKKAALAGLEMFLKEGLQVRVITLPKPHDPDSFIREKGIDLFRKLITEAKGILEVKFTRLCKEYSTNSIDGKLKVISQLLPDIAKIKNDIWKRQFMKKIASALSVPEDSLWIELKRLRKPSWRQAEKTIPSLVTRKAFGMTEEFIGERYLVQLLSDDNPLPDVVRENLNLDELQSVKYRQILELLMKLKDSGRWKGLRSLMVEIKDQTLLNLISQFAVEEISCQDKEKAIMDCLYKVKCRYRETKIRELINKIEKMEKDTMPSRLKPEQIGRPTSAGRQDVSDLVRQIDRLQKELIQLRQDFKKSSFNEVELTQPADVNQEVGLGGR